MIRNLYFSTGIAVAGLVTAYFYDAWAGVALTAILSVLEVSLSFENAIVNAAVLNTMEHKWQERFLTWGIIIAVFGMRLLFPVLLVSCMTHLNPIEVVDLALEQPAQYAEYLGKAHGTISAFGGMFLLMVFLEFILDHKREVHWLGVIERKIAQLGNVEAIEVVVALIILLILQIKLPEDQRATILVAGILGLCSYAIIHGVAKWMNNLMRVQAGDMLKHSGIMSFIYLEVLDASFSFDGVIGAFAITKDIVIIMLGLGIGAFFVRSLTILLVKKQTLQKYIYLEHGAYYALGMLSLLMLIGIYFHIPEILIGSIGVITIALAFTTSLRYLKRNGKS
ncbi:MAG TPA: DUF475 domain-containing protein [Gammaproteobacteria bacterium]|nr:DUF475 domain-containing protein [Gammaproteobacteria bacterium]